MGFRVQDSWPALASRSSLFILQCPTCTETVRFRDYFVRAGETRVGWVVIHEAPQLVCAMHYSNPYISPCLYLVGRISGTCVARGQASGLISAAPNPRTRSFWKIFAGSNLTTVVDTRRRISCPLSALFSFSCELLIYTLWSTECCESFVLIN